MLVSTNSIRVLLGIIPGAFTVGLAVAGLVQLSRGRVRWVSSADLNALARKTTAEDDAKEVFNEIRISIAHKGGSRRC